MNLFSKTEADKLDLEKLKEDIEKIQLKFPDKIPVIVTKNPSCKDLPDLDGRKYRKFLVPSDLTVGQFVYTIRKRIELPPEKAIFVFVNNTLPPTAMLMSTLYERYKSECGFLLMEYSGENTFGEL